MKTQSWFPAILAAAVVAGCAGEPPAEPQEGSARAGEPVQAEPERTPRVQPGTDTGLYSPGLHEAYDGRFVITTDEFQEFADCQDGGIAAFLYEHGDSGCGDANWPKAFAYLAGWGVGSATLNGTPLYDDYQVHFMVTQGMRDRGTLATRYTPGGEPTDPGPVNPASQQIDFYLRSPEENTANHPTREIFDHFFAMEVTWR